MPRGLDLRGRPKQAGVWWARSGASAPKRLNLYASLIAADVGLCCAVRYWAASPSRKDGGLACALESSMDIMTGVGLVSGIIVVVTMMLLGGDLHLFVSEHAIIIIFGGSIAATMIRFPLGVMLHGLP